MTEPKQELILGPSELEPSGVPELSLSGYVEGIEVFHQGLDLGDQEVKAFFSEGEFGSRPIDHIWPQRSMKVPLVVKPTDSLTFDQVRSRLQAMVAQINDGGARLKRILPSGAYAYADLVEAKLRLSASWSAENRDFDREALLELQAVPDWYGAEVVGTAHEFTGDGAFTEVVEGDIPARVINMQVTDLSGNDQNGLMWYYRGRHYSSASTASWAYDAEALGLLDIAEKVTLAGSYGTKVVKHPKLSTEWTPVLSTNMAGTTFLTHTGLYNVSVRVYSTSEDLPWLRLAYGVGDVVAPAELAQLQVPRKEGFYDIPLGLINIPALPFGAQRWEGVIQARGEKGGENISIDRIRFQCADECSGVLLARQSTTALASIVASDSLIGEGALSGSEDTRGHKWEELGGAGGLTRTSEGAERATKADTEGRSVLLATPTVGPVRVRCEVSHSNIAQGMVQGIYLRWFSSTYWARVSLVRVGNNGKQGWLYLEYDIGAGVVPIALANLASFSGGATLDAEISAGAEVTSRLGGQTYRATLPATFRKGEAHAEGKVGIYDYNPSSTAVTRIYTHFTAAPLPPSDAVIYANRSAYLTTTGNSRQSEDGLGAAPVGYPGADLPRLPVSGPSETPVEIAVKPSRGQFGELPDSGIDKFKVQMTYRPCFSEIPSS